MATHQYTRTSSGLTVSAGTDHTFTTTAFTVPTGERFVRMKVNDPNNSTSKIYLRGDAQTVFGGQGMWNTWKSSVSAIWTDGNGVKIKVHNSGTAGYSMRISVTIETEDLPKYSITCKTSGHGSLTASRETAREGQLTTLFPVPDSGYVFSSFTTSPSITVQYDGTKYKFTMPNQALTVTANFTNQWYALTVVSEDTNKGTVTGGGTFVAGSTVTIKATPKAGYIFTGWTKTAGTIGNASAAETTFTIPSSAATVTAHFEPKPDTKSVIGYYHDGAFEDCNVAVRDGDAWVDCDVFIYDNGAWKKCSKGGS